MLAFALDVHPQQLGLLVDLPHVLLRRAEPLVQLVLQGDAVTTKILTKFCFQLLRLRRRALQYFSSCFKYLLVHPLIVLRERIHDHLLRLLGVVALVVIERLVDQLRDSGLVDRHGCAR